MNFSKVKKNDQGTDMKHQVCLSGDHHCITVPPYCYLLFFYNSWYLYFSSYLHCWQDGMGPQYLLHLKKFWERSRSSKYPFSLVRSWLGIISHQNKKAIPRQAFMHVFQPMELYEINAIWSSKPQHKKITGITRKHTNDFSLLCFGLNILVLIIFNTKKLQGKKNNPPKQAKP